MTRSLADDKVLPLSIEHYPFDIDVGLWELITGPYFIKLSKHNITLGNKLNN